MIEARFELAGEFSTGLRPDEKIRAFSVGAGREGIALALNTASANAAFPSPGQADVYDATVLVHDGSTLGRTDLRGVDVMFPQVQTLPGGELLVVGARARQGPDRAFEPNARVFGRDDGRLRREFLLGDGIREIQATRDGHIWVAYFDEGVFGRSAGVAGLVRFDSAGNKDWDYDSPRGREIADCYALNVGDHEVWIYYYVGFWLARIWKDDHVRTWGTPINGASAIAVSQRAVLFYGAGPELFLISKFDRFGRLGRPADVAVVAPEVPIDQGDVVGRGPVLHALSGTSWLQLDVRRIEAA